MSSKYKDEGCCNPQVDSLVKQIVSTASFIVPAISGDREEVRVLEGDFALALAIRVKTVHQVLRHSCQLLLGEVQARVLLIQVGAVLCTKLRDLRLDLFHLRKSWEL